MIGMRTTLLAVLLISGQAAVWAQPSSPLSVIDRDLNLLCSRLGSTPPADAPQLRARLATLWHQREAIVGRLPVNVRAATLRNSTANPQCLNLAKLEAARLPPTAGGSPRPVTRNGTVPPQVKSREPASANTPRYRRAYRRSPTEASPGEPTAVPDIEHAPEAAHTQPPAAANGAPRAPTTTRSAPNEPVVRDATAPVPGTPTAHGTAPNVGTEPAQLQEFFPWPPPAPSSRVLLHLPQLGSGPYANWGQVADQLMALLQRGKFSSWGFYSAPGGFAVVTQIEQLDDGSGHALAGNERFASETRVASLNVLESIFTVRRAQGLYRVISFVLTTDPRSGGAATDPARMLQLARRWGISGALDLPEAMRRQPVIPEQRLFALVYEFESVVGGETRINAPGRYPFDAHLVDAGIVLQP